MAHWKDIFTSSGKGPMGNPETLGVPGTPHPNPGDGPNGINAAQLEPNSRARNMASGMKYQLVPAYPPFIRIANDDRVLYFPRFRTLQFGGDGTTAGETFNDQWQFSLPTIVIARTAAAYSTADANLPVGRNSLDLFTAQMFRASGAQDLIDAGGGGNTGPNVQVLGSSVWGTGQLPALIPGTGLFVDTGSYLGVSGTILIADVLVHLTLWCVEEFSSTGR
jgi:hypothetical protein